MHVATATTRPLLRIPRLALPANLGCTPDFSKLWAGQTVSLFGSEITLLALPLTAALMLGASPWQVGLLAALQRVPYLLIGLFVGVWVDRLRRRPVLLVADVGRGVLLGSVPLAAMLGLLHLDQLYVVAFLVGVLTVFFAVAYEAYLPSLVNRSQLMASNARLETTRSAAEVAGMTTGGILVQAITAPLAIGIDALSYLVSGACLCLIRGQEPPPTRAVEHRGMWSDVKHGLRVTFGNPLLRPLSLCSAMMNLCYQALFAVYVLYATNTLGLDPSAFAVILAAGSAAGVVGAAVASRLGRRFGTGNTLVAGAICSGLAGLIIPVADGPRPLLIGILLCAQALLVFGLPVYNLNAVTLRQTLVPADLLGRVSASARFAAWGAMPLGAALGGLLGEMLGLRPTMLIATSGLLLASLIVVRSPVTRVRDLAGLPRLLTATTG